MISRFLLLAVLSGIAIGGAISVRGTEQASRVQAINKDHVAWVGQVLKQIQTIKPGMTRTDLLTVFATEGGLSTPLHRTFVNRDCPYFKVDVEFRAVGRASHDGDGRETMVEGSQDIIVKISRPYLAFGIVD
jgi:hypothetical protein